MNRLENHPDLKAFDESEMALVEQLFDLQQPPGSALQQRVRSIPQRQLRRRPLTWFPKLAAWGGAALLITLLLFVSPSARATLDELEQVVGQIHLTVRSTRPATPATVTVVTSTPVASLEQARRAVPFPVKMPSHLPAALVSPAEVSVLKIKQSLLKLRWRDSQGGLVQLSATALADRFTAKMVVGPDSSREIEINDRPAVLVRGAWDDETETWRYQNEMITLIWNMDEVQYRLFAYSQKVTLSDLLAMAESIR